MIDKDQLMQDIKNCTNEDHDMVVNCSNCPHYSKGCPNRCRDYLLEEALSLLKAQDAKISELEAEIKSTQNCCITK